MVYDLDQERCDLDNQQLDAAEVQSYITHLVA